MNWQQAYRGLSFYVGWMRDCIQQFPLSHKQTKFGGRFSQLVLGKCLHNEVVASILQRNVMFFFLQDKIHKA